MLIKKLELNVNSFSVRCDLLPQNVHNMVSGRLTKPSFDALVKILSTFAEINAEWLILGRGEIFKKDPGTTVEEPREAYGNEIKVWKDKYIDLLEENRNLTRELLVLNERLRGPAGDIQKSAG